MNIILTCENLKIDNEIFRKKLLNIILNENEYISNYIDLINSIINEFIKNKVEIMGDIFELIQNNKEESFELLKTGKVKVDSMTTFYNISELNEAIADTRSGKILKAFINFIYIL